MIDRSEIVISGRHDVLLDGVRGKQDLSSPAVPSFDREWRASQNKTANNYVVEIAF